MNNNEKLFIESFINHNDNISKAQKYIKENFNIDSKYDETKNILHLFATNINENLNLVSAKDYVLSIIDETMIQIKYGY